MMDFFVELNNYLSYEFVRFALVTGVLIALCSSLLGSVLVLKRLSFIGDGLSHVAFLSFAIAGVLQIFNDMLVVLPITVLVAVLILSIGKNTKMSGDATIAIFSVSSLGLGYLLMNLFSRSSNITGDVCSTLFGSIKILTLKQVEVNISIVLSIIVILLFIIFYHKIYLMTFDENFAKTSGINIKLYDFIFSIVIAVVIVLSMNLVGSLLISAFVIFPSVAGMSICRSFKGVTIYAAIFSVICTFIGILVSIFVGTPVGSTIVAIDIVGLIISFIIGKCIKLN